MGRTIEDDIAGSSFHYTATTLAHPADRDGIGQAPGLGEIMGHHQDRIAPFETRDQRFDDLGSDRVERAAGFIEEKHLGREREGAGDAEPLLLAARQRKG
jgi:hypothetical protein